MGERPAAARHRYRAARVPRAAAHWGGGKLNATTLALSPLSRRGDRTAGHALLDRPLLPAEDHAAVVERAGGNPLYAEQYARMLVERALSPGLPSRERAGDHRGTPRRALAGAEAPAAGRLRGREGVLERGARRARRRRPTGSSSRRSTRSSGRTSCSGRGGARWRAPRSTRSATSWSATWRTARFPVRRAARSIEPPRCGSSLSAAREEHAEMLAHHYVTALELARAAGTESDELVERGAACARRRRRPGFGAERVRADGGARSSGARARRPRTTRSGRTSCCGSGEAVATTTRPAPRSSWRRAKACFSSATLPRPPRPPSCSPTWPVRPATARWWNSTPRMRRRSSRSFLPRRRKRWCSAHSHASRISAQRMPRPPARR